VGVNTLLEQTGTDSVRSRPAVLGVNFGQSYASIAVIDKVSFRKPLRCTKLILNRKVIHHVSPTRKESVKLPVLFRMLVNRW
jgi:hypothetical protein